MRHMFLLASLTTLALISSASAAVFSDNFNTGPDSGLVAGRTADTGQTWTGMTLFTPAGGGLYMNTAYSTNGTFAAGSGVGDTGNSVLLGTTLTSGPVILDVDIESPGAYNTPQFWLSNSAGSANASLNWRADTGALGWEGLGVSAFFVDTDTANNTGDSLVRSLHLTLSVDLDAKTFAFSWFDNADPGDGTTSGSSGPHSYSPTYQPDRLHIYRNGGNGLSYSGLDNIVIAVPEPTSLGLLALSALAIRRRK